VRPVAALGTDCHVITRRMNQVSSGSRQGCHTESHTREEPRCPAPACSALPNSSGWWSSALSCRHHAPQGQDRIKVPTAVKRTSRGIFSLVDHVDVQRQSRRSKVCSCTCKVVKDEPV
jgi:hypothetical protein